MSNLPERMRELRAEKRKTQRELAEFLGMKLRGYQCYEMGETEPSLDKLFRLADYYQVSLDYLTGRTEQR